jgi:hypothetical protein
MKELRLMTHEERQEWEHRTRLRRIVEQVVA